MTLSRREFLDFLKATCAVAALPGALNSSSSAHNAHILLAPMPAGSDAIVNDIHSQLNSTRVNRIIRPVSSNDLRATILTAKSHGNAISIAGGRHAMGGQQFGAGTILVDMTGMNRVLNLDVERGILEVEAGIEWPELLDYLARIQAGREKQWGILQKQTGADRLSIGGALASNVHGRGLKFKPIIDQVDSFTLMDHTGAIVRCSRDENSELFQLVIGGYGLFGIVTSVRLRLWERRKVQRIVDIRDTKDIIQAFQQRIADGYLYGDFQFATENSRDSFLRRGVFSCYRPVDPATPLTVNPTRFHPQDWARESLACVIFNLHVTHDTTGLENATAAFRTLIDLSIKHGGSYYLTYHRFPTKEQVVACYPQFREFLDLKLRHDPDEVFQSDWYRHYKKMFGPVA